MFIDFHIHSNHSHDGKSSVKEMIEKAEMVGLDSIAFAEHSTYDDFFTGIKAYEESQKYSTKIKIYPATELNILNPSKNKKDKRNRIHCVVLGEISELEKALNNSPQTIEDLFDYKLIKILAHPIKLDLNIENGIVDFFDLIEFSKYMPGLKKNNQYYSESNLDGRLVASSDSHSKNDLKGRTKTAIKKLYDSPIQTLNIKNIIKIESGKNRFFSEPIYSF